MRMTSEVGVRERHEIDFYGDVPLSGVFSLYRVGSMI